MRETTTLWQFPKNFHLTNKFTLSCVEGHDRQSWTTIQVSAASLLASAGVNGLWFTISPPDTLMQRVRRGRTQGCQVARPWGSSVRRGNSQVGVKIHESYKIHPPKRIGDFPGVPPTPAEKLTSWIFLIPPAVFDLA